MRELIDPELTGKVLLLLAVAGPLVGLILGAMLGARDPHATPKMVAGVLLGGLTTVAYGMWCVYGVITNWLGLDSVTNLALQLVMFAALGAMLGVAAYRMSALLKKPGG